MPLPSRPLLLAAALLIALPAALQAAPDRDRPGNARPGERLAQIDRNGDGRIDRAEAAAAPRLAERFERIDRNRDGVLDAGELRDARRMAEARRDVAQAKARMMRARFEWLDADGDRALTLAELGDDAPKLRERFVAIDSNRDGRLVPDEMRAYAKGQREQRRQQRG
jgi:hypothetical protein